MVFELLSDILKIEGWKERVFGRKEAERISTLNQLVVHTQPFCGYFSSSMRFISVNPKHGRAEGEAHHSLLRFYLKVLICFSSLCSPIKW
jgi:hypothetical protein